MKFLVLTVFALMITITPAFATSLENTELNAKSAVIALDIKFGQDEIKSGLFRTIVIPQLESIYLSFYGNEIPLSEPEIKVVNNHFRISSIPEGIMMFGHKNTDIDNYDINIYFPTNEGLTKFSVSTIILYPEDKVAETEPTAIKEYVPELRIISDVNYKTYWSDTFNMDVQAFDANINKDPKRHEFDGRLDDVDITVIISLGDEIITTLKGITSNNGHWDGEHYFSSLSSPGEYNVDILASLGNQTVSKSTSTFVIAYYSSLIGAGGNHTPVAIAGADDITPNASTLVTLDASASSDSDGDSLTFSWVQTSDTTVMLDDDTAEMPTFATGSAGSIYIFTLTVTDPKGASSTDTVTITVT